METSEMVYIWIHDSKWQWLSLEDVTELGKRNQEPGEWVVRWVPEPGMDRAGMDMMAESIFDELTGK